MIAVSSGDAELARRWFRRAQVAASASGDTHLQASVMGLHAVEGVFGMHAPARVLALANKTLAITDAPCIGRQRALSARVRALALQGRKRETRNALKVLEEGFERLPRDITREKIGVNGWDEAMLLNVTSFASAFAGVDGGEAAREEALRLYSTALWRGPSQVKLHRAIAETDAHMALDALAPPPTRSARTSSYGWSASRHSTPARPARSPERLSFAKRWPRNTQGWLAECGGRRECSNSTGPIPSTRTRASVRATVT